MTHLQKRKLISAVLIVLTFVLFACVAIFEYYVFTYLSPVERRKSIYVLYGFLAVYILFIFYVNRPKEVKLSKEELQQPVVPVVNIKNVFAWRVYILMIIITFFGCATLWLSDYMRHSTFDSWYWLTLFIVVVFSYLITLLYYRRNEYIIEGKTLIVREYKFSRLDTDLRIPIDTIDSVYIKSNYSLMPRVVLDIHGLKRELRCISHTDELAVEILLRKANAG